MSIPSEVRLTVTATPSQECISTPNTANLTSAFVATNNIPWASGNGANIYGFTFTFDDTTGIISPLAPTADGAWYTLDGRRLTGRPVFSGIYIHNGKKVIVKR